MFLNCEALKAILNKQVLSLDLKRPTLLCVYWGEACPRVQAQQQKKGRPPQRLPLDLETSNKSWMCDLKAECHAVLKNLKKNTHTLNTDFIF